MMTKDGLIFEANSLKQGRLQALTRQQLQAQAIQNRERRWVAPFAPFVLMVIGLSAAAVFLSTTSMTARPGQGWGVQSADSVR